jgi:hypothetical protein
MPRYTIDQVKTLAPDPASFKSGQGLADERHWSNLGGNEAVIWGECKGNGQEPYKVRIDLSNNGSACTCPSRKIPCKHVLGLMLLASSSSYKHSKSAPPAWVAEWLEKRATRKLAAVKREETKADPEARQKEVARRAAKREKLATTGIQALERWLKDFARIGLAAAQSAPQSFWDEQTARMVDCQLPGVARMIRKMSSLPGSRPDWAEVMLVQLGRLYLLAQAYHKLDILPEVSRQDVHTLLGWNVNQEELISKGAGLGDDWLVLASRTEEDEKSGLRTQFNWLWGKTSHSLAQILNFAYQAEPLDASLVPGLALCGELVYFPGAYPLRALFKDKHILECSFTPSGFHDLATFLEAYASALGKNPWLEAYPSVLENVRPVPIEQNWYLSDSQDQAIPLAAQFIATWELYALSGGHPLNIFGLWDGICLTPMTVWAEGRCVFL